eukprot:TRINITY_DN89867_c0_g1_i1.p8 TRINITY_DN89867_c0_g1~~TRINITY_DN89867_c0_g1_i1.p8  ORF type:complete len:164 (-),score=46.74 TRINITY_DN89867_c0_g1_i1:1281-1772(-)
MSKDILIEDPNMEPIEEYDPEISEVDEPISGEDEEILSEEGAGGMYEDMDPREEIGEDQEEPADYSGDDAIDRVKDDVEMLEEAENNEENAGEEEEGYTNAAMVKEIETKEKELLEAKKHWQMTGEVLATERPINSLVEETLDFQLATKLPLVHTVYLLLSTC